MRPEPEFPWDRRTDESTRMYLYFKYYLGRGLARTVKDVADEFSISRTRAYVIARQYEWHDRAAAWDTDVQRREEEARNLAFRQYAVKYFKSSLPRLARDAKTAAKLNRKIAEMLNHSLYVHKETIISEDGKETTNIYIPSKWSIRDVRHLLAARGKLEERIAEVLRQYLPTVEEVTDDGDELDGEEVTIIRQTLSRHHAMKALNPPQTNGNGTDEGKDKGKGKPKGGKR